MKVYIIIEELDTISLIKKVFLEEEKAKNYINSRGSPDYITYTEHEVKE